MFVRETCWKVLFPATVLFLALVAVMYFKHSHAPAITAELSPTPPVVKLAPVLIPNFSQFTDVKQKKRAFFEYMLPMVIQENERLLRYREQLMVMQSTYAANGRVTAAQRKWVYELANTYRIDVRSVDDGQIIRQLLIRVDTVPISLALSQSANESAWGTSRFALQANNLFGQWCFSKGCGLVPHQRPAGASYEVASFTSPQASVGSYIHNLNTNSAYSYFRELRVELRNHKLALSGDTLAEGLGSYSIRGDDYIEELRAMIRINRLAQYDTI